MYVHTVRRSIYETRQPEHPHLSILRYKQRPQGPSFQGPIIKNPARTQPYSFLRIRLCLQSPHLCCSHHHHKHFTAASKVFPSLHQVPDASTIIVIRSYVLAAISVNSTC